MLALPDGKVDPEDGNDQAPYCEIMPLDQSAKFRCWSAEDYAEAMQAMETFALKSRRALVHTATFPVL